MWRPIFAIPSFLASQACLRETGYTLLRGCLVSFSCVLEEGRFEYWLTVVPVGAYRASPDSSVDTIKAIRRTL